MARARTNERKTPRCIAQQTAPHVHFAVVSVNSIETRSTRPQAFSHPLWWSALALLVLNDHVWKGAGVLPSSLTGKLSDIVGLIVAPPVCAIALGAGRRHRPALAALLVGLGFALIKLSPLAATGLADGLGVLGIPSRFWADPTDLWALPALSFGYALSRPILPSRPGARAAPGLGGPWLQRAGVVAGALGCVATGGSDSADKGVSGDAPGLKNDTKKPLTVVLAATEGAGGCNLYRENRIGVLTPAAFIGAREVTIEPGEVAALAEGDTEITCGAASIRLPAGEQLLVFWRDLDSIESFVPDDDASRLDRLVEVGGGRGHYEFKVGDDLGRFEFGEVPTETTCDEPDSTDSLEWTPLLEAQAFLELSEVRKGTDGCFELDWFKPEGDTSADSQRLCVPKWAFPFKVGDQLSVVQELHPLGERMLRITRFVDDKIDVQLVVWNDAAEFPDSRIKAIPPVECFGAVSACGAYLRPVRLEARGLDDPLRQGEDATIDGDDPKETRVMLGAGRDVGWSAPTCEGPEARLGPSANVLELRIF